MENLRKIIEEIQCVLLSQNYVFSYKQKYIERLMNIIKQIIGLQSIEVLFEDNKNNIKYFISPFLKDIIRETLSQQDEEEGYEYCSLLLDYIDFFCMFYKHKEYDQILQSYLIDIFDPEKPIYSSFLETYEKFNDLLPKNPSKFCEFAIGDEVDVLIPQNNNSENGNWVRGKIKEITEDENGDVFYDINTSDDKKYYQFKKDSINIQKLGTMTTDWEWRISLKERDIIDVFDRGEWYPATVLQKQKHIINGIIKLNYKIGFLLFINDFPEWRNYSMFWKGKNLSKDQQGNVFIGDSFTFDKVIPHYSKKIQRFKSCIFTQTFPERKLLIDEYYLYTDPHNNEKKHLIIGRNFKNFRYAYALLLKEFYEQGGYSILLHMFDCEKDNSNNNRNSNLIYTCLYILSGSLCYFHKDFFEEVSEGFISKCYDFFNNADIKQMRNIRKETIDLMIQVVSFFEQSKSNPNHALINKFFLLMIIKLFKTNIFDKRLLGVKILNDYIKSITNQTEQIYKFIQENNIINEIFGSEGHEQFVSKGIGIIEELIKHNYFHENDLEILWLSKQKGNIETKLSVIKLLKDNITKMNEGLIIIIIEKINAEPKETLLLEELDLLFIIAMYFSFDDYDNIGLFITDYLIKNESINDQDKFKKIGEMIIQLMHKNKKYEAYFDYCIKQIKEYTYSVNVLKFLLFLFEKFGICIKKNIKEYNQENIMDFINDDNMITINNNNTNHIMTFPNTNSGNSGNNNNTQLMNNQELIKAIDSRLINDNVLLKLYEENFKTFKANYFNTIIKTNNNIQDQLHIRIDFISILNKYHPAFDSLSFLSSILISEPSDPQWQRSLFTFIRKNLESSETTNNTIFTLFINKIIDFPALRLDNQIIAYEIFNEVFLSENMKKNNMMYFPNARNDNALPSYDIQCSVPPNKLIGFEHLWNIIFGSKASCVLNHGMKIIYSLYYNFIDELIDKIFNQLKERNKVIQMISFMTYIMKESEKTMMSLITSHKSILIYDKIMLYIISSTGRESYYLYSSITLYNFKLLLSYKRNCAIDKMILSHRGSQLKDIDHIKTLHELGFQTNDDICFTTIIDITQKPLISQAKMSPEYEKIINSWFSIFSSEEKMDAESLAQFTSTSTGTQMHFEPDDIQIKDILLNYDIGSKGYLTREEFNKLYFDKAMQMPHYIYNSLNLMGIRNDLREINEAVVIDILPKEKVIRYRISNDSNWITLMFNILKEDNSIELFDFIFSLCTNYEIYSLILNGKIIKEIISNRYIMIYCLYLIESYLTKDNQYINIKERDDNEILKMYPEFKNTINSTAFFKAFIEENSHITLFTYYTQNDYDLSVYCDRILVEHLVKVITKILMKQNVIDSFDTTLLFNKQLSILFKGNKEDDIEIEESLMMNGFELIMHLLVFKLTNISDIIIANKQKLLHLIMNGLINKNTSVKKYFGENLIKYTQLSEKTNKQEIVSFLFECCFNIFHKLKTENNLNDLSFFFEYFTSMFENYSSDDNHLAFVNEIIQEIKTNKEIPNEILIGYIKILTKAIKSTHNNDIKNTNTNFLMKYIMDNIVFQKTSPHLIKIDSIESEYINPSEYINSKKSKESGIEKKENNILQSAFNYIKEIFKHINRKEDIEMIEEFFKQKESYEQFFNPKKSMSNYYQSTGNSNSNSNINGIKRRNNNHAGLDNLGFTCYMNSAIQQLFYIDTFRNAILQSPISTDDNINMTDSDVNTNIMYQLKKLFAYLDISIRSSYDPKAFVASFNSIMNNGLNVIGQQDSQEFLNSFFDVIEKQIKSSKYKYIIEKTFIGRICSMIICDSCHHTSLRFENFYSLSLDVSNMKNLSNSLEKFISYEIIDEFKCEGCNQKVQIKKRNLLCDLPNILIVHLKRFNMNYETCLTEKLNSRLEFPFSLLLDKYCVETIGGTLNNDEIYRKKDDYYNYSLIGVIVHSGTAEEGHYFSIINNKKDKKWIKVNDSEVTDFDISKLGNECFGESNDTTEDNLNDGNWLSDNNNNNFLDDDNNSKQNAYLLFYEKKSKSDIIIIQDNYNNDSIDNEFINPSEASPEIIQLSESNSKEILKKYDKDRIDYNMKTDQMDQNINRKYFYFEAGKELYYYSPFNSIEYLIPKDIYIEILKDNFPLEKCINYFEENYNDFYNKVFKTIQLKAIEINIDDYGDRWLEIILLIIFVNQRMITANQLKVLNRFLSTHFEKILDYFANKSSIEELFITSNNESIEFLVSLLIELIQYSFAQIDSKAYDDSINVVYQIISLFPKINFHYVNKIYPLYNLFYSLVQSNDFWTKMFIENHFIKNILAYIMGKDSRIFYEFTVINDHWDATRPSNLINVNQLFTFLQYIIKKTTIYQQHKYIKRNKDDMAIDNDQNNKSFDLPLNELKWFAEDNIMRMVYAYNFDLFKDLNIILQYNDKEDSINLCKELCHLIFKTMISDDIQSFQLMSLIFDIIAMNDKYQLIRLQIIFGYQSVLTCQAQGTHGLPLLGLQIKQKWLHFISNYPQKNSTLMRKLFCLSTSKQIKYIIQLLNIINEKEKNNKEESSNNANVNNEQSILFEYLINIKSPNYNQPQFISFLLDYLSKLINIESESTDKDTYTNTLNELTKDINAMISAYPSDFTFNKYIPDKIKYEEVSIECQGKGMFLFKTKYYTSVYPHDNDKLNMIKDTYPFINLDYNNNIHNINILDSIDRESSDRLFYKKIIPMVTSSNKLIVVSQEDIEYPLLTVVRYGIFNNYDCEADVSTKITLKDTSRKLIENKLPDHIYTTVAPKEYKEVFVINKNDYFDENNAIDDIIINIQLEWKNNYFHQRNTGE